MMPDPLPSASCPRCGNKLPPDASGGVCPACAFGEALAEAPADGGADLLSLEDIPVPASAEASPEAPRAQQSARSRKSKDRPGDRIGRYKLLEEIGEGGCGVVYKAEQEQPVRRRVALKVIKLGMDTQAVIARFEAERQALALMDHPNIAKILDAGATETGRPYFVMELVNGLPITKYCDDNHLSTTERLGFFIQVCQAIEHAHQKSIVHRDIKPSNILVTLQDGVPVPKVIDFGIAKAITNLRLTDKPVYTAIDQFIGTPAYMSPEQAKLSGLDIDTRSDIYALGVLLYELLTGKTPFDSKRLLEAGLDEIRRVIREEEPPRPSTRVSMLTKDEQTTISKHRQSEPPKLQGIIRGDLDWIVMKTLEKDRTRRYPTSSGLAADIQRYLSNEVVEARPPSQLYRLQKAFRRNRLAFGAAAAILMSLMLGLVMLAVSQGLKTQRDVARQVIKTQGAVRKAELATRNGQWREAPKLWSDAEAAGYSDAVRVGLERAVAYNVLSEPERALEELNKLVHRRDLGDQGGAVLLLLGESELYAPATYQQGLAHVREAQAGELSKAQREFAEGLLATNTPAALGHFRQALRLDPYLHGAHVHSFGLEYALGQWPEARAHAKLCRLLFPDDASADFLEASELAYQGRLAEAQQKLASLRDAANPQVLQQLSALLRLHVSLAKDFDVEAIIENGGKAAPRRDTASAYDNAALFAASPAESPNWVRRFRTPQLPCIRAGLIDAAEAITTLLLPTTNSIAPVVEKVKASWRSHPEATLPFKTAELLGMRQPPDGSKSLPLLATQAELYQLAADSSANVPGMNRTARYRAVQAQIELARSQLPNAAEFQRSCRENLRRAAADPDTSAAECRAYFDVALEVNDPDVAGQLLYRWQQLQPADPRLMHSRVRWSVAMGAFGSAWKLLDQMSAENPADAWVQTQRQTVANALQALAKQVSNSH